MAAIAIGLAVAVLHASSPDATSTAWAYENALERCAPTSFDQAVKCVSSVLTSAGLDRVKAEPTFRFDLDKVISDAWNLRDPGSLLSTSLAKEDLYYVEPISGFIVSAAEELWNGRSVNKKQIAELLAKIAADAPEWKPRVPKSWREVAIGNCQKMSNSGELNAKCFVQPDGTHVVVSPSR